METLIMGQAEALPTISASGIDSVINYRGHNQQLREAICAVLVERRAEEVYYGKPIASRLAAIDQLICAVTEVSTWLPMRFYAQYVVAGIEVAYAEATWRDAYSNERSSMGCAVFALKSQLPH